MDVPRNQIIVGDCLESLRALPDGFVQCCVTSPPYWGLRDYGVDGQIGLEETPDAFIAKLVAVFREVRRVLRADGTCWVNMGDSYHTGDGYRADPSGSRVKQSVINMGHDAADLKAAPNRQRQQGLKPKDLCGIPWMLAFALRADGWYLRQDIIWHKPNPMPESVTDRCTKSHEYIFLLSKSERYFYDNMAIMETSTGQSGSAADFARSSKEAIVPGQSRPSHRADRKPTTDTGTRNKRSVWTITTRSYREAHFATFPPELPELCIEAGSKQGDIVLDPFGGSGTTAHVAANLGRDWLLCELNPAYVELIKRRIYGPMFAETVSATST